MAEHDLKRLFRIQELEQKLIRLERFRKTSPETQLVNELQERAGKFQKLQSVLDKRIAVAQRSVRSRELALAAAEQSQGAVRERLYEGGITNPRELSQLEKRLAELTVQVEKEETDLLQALEELETLEAQKSKVDAAEAKARRELHTAQQKLEHMQSAWDLEEAMVRDELEELRSQVSPSALALYERKKASTEGTPIAQVIRGVCGGCRMTLPASVTALRGAVTSTCEQCGRILYLPD